MQTKKFRSLGLDVNLKVPSSVDEFDQNAKRAGACLDEAINNCVYRGSLAEFRDSFQAVVAEKTGIERKTKPVIDPKTKQPKLDADKNPVEAWDESEAEYIGRVRQEKGWNDDNVGPLQDWANEIAEALVFDASAPERKPTAPKKLAQKFKDVATRIFNNNSQEKYRAQWNLVFTGDRDKDIETLGWAVKKDVESKLDAELAGVS